MTRDPRHCPSCGLWGRMDGQPEGASCTLCTGVEVHSSDRVEAARAGQFVYLRGAYDSKEELGPGQGRGPTGRPAGGVR